MLSILVSYNICLPYSPQNVIEPHRQLMGLLKLNNPPNNFTFHVPSFQRLNAQIIRAINIYKSLSLSQSEWYQRSISPMDGSFSFFFMSLPFFYLGHQMAHRPYSIAPRATVFMHQYDGMLVLVVYLQMILSYRLPNIPLMRHTAPFVSVLRPASTTSVAYGSIL